MIKKIIQILEHYGYQHQKLKAVEELTELCELIIKDVNKDTHGVGLIGEIADVYVMLEQLKLIYDIDPSDLRDTIEFKLDRQLQRINMEE